MSAYQDINALSALGCSEIKLRSASDECFPGQYFDEETNLHYNHFRYYDPSIGRYITSDPIGIGITFNTYSYAMTNSVRFTDPTGEIVPALLACGVNAACAGAVRALFGGVIGGLSAFAAAVNDPCFDGSLLRVTGAGIGVGISSSFIPGAGSLASAFIRGGAAGAGGDFVGQFAVNESLEGFDPVQNAMAAATGAAALASGNIAGYNSARAAFGKFGKDGALAIGGSLGVGSTTVVEGSVTLTGIAADQRKSECSCTGP